ncbi:MAG TPA: ABC transporter substrate-binding protein [Xanthobacteraceae bacterium]|jgi:ABC-type nitrate/sulfonate/bicarbonate transport system substrate-binding protein|nr:ABC transporter substrate-binding protein [Xanthobacteraceae bacterium]
MTMRRITITAIAALAGSIIANAADAETTLRVGKAQANQFAFIPADVGVDTGIFKKHGIDLDISAFGGDAKMVQGLTAGSLDIALGGSPSFAAIVKGAPMKAVAAFSGAPNIIMLVVLKDGPLKTVGDLKGRTVSVSGAGSLTYWLTQQLSRRLGFGDDGIKIIPLGASEAQIAALMTHQIDGTTTDSVTVEKFVEAGQGRILVKLGDYFPDFVTSCVYASNALIANNPDALRAFLAGWFETIAYMRDHRAAVVDITVKQIGVSAGVAGAIYDDTMPTMSLDGRFNPKALDLLADSFVATHALPDKPDMSQLLTEAFLPK